MSVDTDEPTGKSLKEMAAKWVFSQGVSTVLLFVLIIGVWYGIPAHIEMVQKGYDKNAVQLKEATAPVAASVDRLAERMDRVIDELRRSK